jgi:hypothetical protein
MASENGTVDENARQSQFEALIDSWSQRAAAGTWAGVADLNACIWQHAAQELRQVLAAQRAARAS